MATAAKSNRIGNPEQAVSTKEVVLLVLFLHPTPLTASPLPPVPSSASLSPSLHSTCSLLLVVGIEESVGGGGGRKVIFEGR